MEDQLALLRMQKVNNYILEDKTLQVTVIRMDGKSMAPTFTAAT